MYTRKGVTEIECFIKEKQLLISNKPKNCNLLSGPNVSRYPTTVFIETTLSNCRIIIYLSTVSTILVFWLQMCSLGKNGDLNDKRNFREAQNNP